MATRMTISNDPMSNDRVITIYMEKQFDVQAEGSAIRRAMIEAAKMFAEKWIEENRDMIIARLNVDAIANMIMLEVANDIKKDARKV